MTSSSKKTIVLGASPRKDRYSYTAVRRLQQNGHEVIPIGFTDEKIGEMNIVTEFSHHSDVDTVTLYLNPVRQREYYNYILSLNPKRIIFNPGTENDELASMAQAQGIETIEACTLVMLSIGNY